MLIFNRNLPMSQIMTIDENEIEEFNRLSVSFKRGANTFFDGTTLADIKNIINTSFSSHSGLSGCKVPKITPENKELNVIPDSYNFHTEHPRCGSKVANQQSNNICYAYL